MANQSDIPKTRVAAPKKPGIYARGSETVDAILKAALHVLIEEGASAFTLRRIAQQCGLNVGNVSRHFPRKEMLVQVLLEELLSTSQGFAPDNIGDMGLSPEDALAYAARILQDQLNVFVNFEEPRKEVVSEAIPDLAFNPAFLKGKGLPVPHWLEEAPQVDWRAVVEPEPV